MTLSQSGFTSPARPRGAGGATRETDSIFSALRARCAGHGARARARLATGGSPVDSPSAEPSGAEICLARPSRKRPAGRKKHNFTLLHVSTFLSTLGKSLYRPHGKGGVVFVSRCGVCPCWRRIVKRKHARVTRSVSPNSILHGV